MEDKIDKETIAIIEEFCKETENSLEELEESIKLLKPFVYSFSEDFHIRDFIIFHHGTNFKLLLENIRNINRVVHTIKGVSSFIGLSNINQYCHDLEDLTSSISKGEVILDDQAFLFLERIPLLLNRFLEDIKETYSDQDISVVQEIKEIKECSSNIKEKMQGAIIHYDELSGKDFGRVRNFEKKLEIKIPLEKFDSLINNFHSFIQSSFNQLKNQGIDLDALNHLREQMRDHLQNLISSSLSRIVLSRYRRIVIDLSSLLDKRVIFELKRNEAFARPDLWDHCHNALVHLVRNAVDHGIEDQAKDRIKQGKPAEGKIQLDIHEDENHINIIVEDDGQGLDGSKIATSALKKGLITKQAMDKMSEKEKQQLIFLPDFSTRDKTTKVSGRGVGMDAVSKEIRDNLNGRIEVLSQKYLGTKFILKIPK